MFYHVIELQFNARVSQPDPRFARMMLEAFGGKDGELKSAMQYFVQAFSCHNPFPKHYDMLMDIAAEELAHLEIVGATIHMLLGPVNARMKDAVNDMPINRMMEGKTSKEEFIPTLNSFLCRQAAPCSPTATVIRGAAPMYRPIPT